MYNPFNNISVDVYGESHAEKVGVKIYGLPKNTAIDLKEVQQFVDRRKSGQNAWSTPRKEADEVVFESGIDNGVINGEIEAVIYNTNVKSNDYSDIKHIPRPSHADFCCAVKDKTNVCPSGGGRFSARLTAPLCVAGAIAKQILSKRGIKVLSYVREIGGVLGESYLSCDVSAEMIESIPTELKALSNAEAMEQAVKFAQIAGDSVGGRADVIVFGMPVGFGDNLFSGLEGRLSSAIFGVPAVKGVEFGLGFGFAKSLGSVANDPFVMNNGRVETKTNNSGGINGGISNGMPICMSVAFRPTPSISKEQDSVNLKTGENVKLSIKGRHDSCIVPRGAVVLEAVVALTILDILMDIE